jgi:hypothetical protein
MTVVCCRCHEAYGVKQVKELTTEVSHGVCPVCEPIMRKELEEEAKELGLTKGGESNGICG